MPMPGMDIHHRHGFFSIVALSLPLFFFFFFCSAAPATTTTSAPLFPPPSTSHSLLTAADELRTRGYSLFASALISTNNLSGTILAPRDFAFSFATAKFSLRAPLRPSTTLLLYHTLQPPSLAWLNITSRPNGDELQTFYNNNCVFLFKNPNGDVSLSSSKKPLWAITIRQPDLYVDDNLIVHGVDGVLDPITATKCSSKPNNLYPMDEILSRDDHRSFLDHAIRVLRRRGFQVVATAMAVRSSELLTLTAVTIFAPSDRALFSQPKGFRFNFRRHIVPRRLRFTDLVTILDGSYGSEFESLAPNKTLFLQSSAFAGAISVNGAIVDGAELYHNRWIVVYSVSTTLDDVRAELLSPLPESHFTSKSNGSPSPTLVNYGNPNPNPGPPSAERHIPAEVSSGVSGVAPVNRQEHVRNVTGDLSVPPSPERHIPFVVQGVAPLNGQERAQDITGEPVGVPNSPSPEKHIAGEVSREVPGESMGPPWPPLSPAHEPEMSDVTERQCAREGQNGGVQAVTVGVKGADLFCPDEQFEEHTGGSIEGL